MTPSSTHFGYQTVDLQDKQPLVDKVFHSVASRYDLMNDLMSFGVHRLWKRLTVELSGVRKGYRVLDLAGGTGDLTAQFAKRVGETGEVTLADINASMLQEARRKLVDKGLVGNIRYEIADAQALPFPNHYFDVSVIAFGLRNVPDQLKALQSLRRTLKPGGQLLILEFSKPILEPLRLLYDLYSFQVIPKLGEWVAQDKASYQYLVESIRMHPDQDTLLKLMQAAGFEDCRYSNLSSGIVALHRGRNYL